MKYSKSNDSKEKEVKKYRLQSILKLHNKIHNENLKVVAAKGLSLYKMISGDQTTSFKIINLKLNDVTRVNNSFNFSCSEANCKSFDLSITAS